jgi:hypothetical protein
MTDRAGATIRSAQLAVRVEDRGARIAAITHLPSGTEFLLRTPWAGERWDPLPLEQGSNAEWHRRYAGGWHTLLPHAGDERVLRGIAHPFHGEAAWRLWSRTGGDEGSCTHRVLLRSAPLEVTRTVAVAADAVTVTQQVANLSAERVGFTWTEHPAFGAALIGPRSTVSMGGVGLGIAFPGEEGGLAGFRTFEARGTGDALVSNPATGVSARLRWDTGLLPYLHVWQEHHASDGFPWWRAVSTIALEPASRPYGAAEGQQAALGPIELDPFARMSTVFELLLGVERPR